MIKLSQEIKRAVFDKIISTVQVEPFCDDFHERNTK